VEPIKKMEQFEYTTSPPAPRSQPRSIWTKIYEDVLAFFGACMDATC
jgi:hypothetical protein